MEERKAEMHLLRMVSPGRRQRERQIIDEGTAIWKIKRKRELLWEAEEKKLNRAMLATYNPWGKPGNGAPMPGALRKTKWMPEESTNVETNPRSALSWGRPGHGAPMKTSAGKTWAYIKSDPLIRFQMHDDGAKVAIENELRYKSTPQDKENYRKELDFIVCQKSKIKNLENETQNNLKGNKGWTNEDVLRKIDRSGKRENVQEQIYEITGGGVELVPLLAKHRVIARCPLSTTDVTKMFRICNQFSKPGLPASDYFRQLCYQVEEKEKHKREEEHEEMIQNQKHFETWREFWGRPGHGAPKLLNQRENLEFLLYRKPSQRIVPFTKKPQ